MSNRKTIYENSKLEDKELVKYLLNELLDEIDYLSLYDQKYKVGTIANEINKQIKAEEDIKKIMELSRDIEQFFKQGGNYNELEYRIKYAPKIDSYDSIMNVYDVYLENVYRFVLFESFIERKTLLENEEIKEMVNNKITRAIKDNIELMATYSIGSTDDKYKYLNHPVVMEDIFLKSNIMSKELRDKLFIEEFKTISTKHSESMKAIKNKKKKLLKLRILLGAFALGGAISLGTAGVSTVRLINGNGHITHEDGSWTEADKAYLGAILLFVFIVCSGFTLFALSELKEELELDEEHYKKLCTLLDDLKITRDMYIDVNKLKETMNKCLKDEPMIIIDDKGRMVLPGGVRVTIDKNKSDEEVVRELSEILDYIKEEEKVKTK